MALIEVKKLKKKYDKLLAVKGIDFEVQEGEVFGILGPNGAGKTTTLEMMEGLRPITAGSIIIDGIDVNADPDSVKEIIGVQLQASAFFDNLNLTELLQVFRDLYATRRDPHELLKEVGLTAKAKTQVKALSGGQKQRFSIAAALVNDPTVLFLDEPTTGLDPQARRNVWELVQDIQSKDKTIILTTHYMDEAELLCNRIAIMDAGKIIALDTPANLINQLLKRGFKKQQPVQKANLEDVFIDLTGKHMRE